MRSPDRNARPRTRTGTAHWPGPGVPSSASRRHTGGTWTAGPTACGGTTGGADTTAAAVAEDITLRVAMGSPGEAQIRVWEAAKALSRRRNPNVKVEINYQEDDLYQTIGLPTCSRRANAPTSTSSGPGQAAAPVRRRLRRRPHRGG